MMMNKLSQSVELAERIKQQCARISNKSSNIALNRRFTNRSVNSLPYLATWTRQYEEFLVDLALNLNDISIVDIDDHGFATNNFVRNFDCIRTRPGSTRVIPFGQGKVATIPNSSVESDLDDSFGQLATLLVRSMDLNKICKLPLDTNNGMPFCSSDNSKLPHWLAILADNLKEIEMLFRDQDFETLAVKYGVMFCALTNVRLQNDKWEGTRVKHRELKNFAEAFGLEDDLTAFEADWNKEMYNSNLANSRTRQVNGGNKALTMSITAALEPIRAGFEAKYPKTYKSLDKVKMYEHMNKYKYIKGIDVSSYDFNLGLDIATKLVASLPLTNIWKQVIVAQMCQPVFCSDINGKGLSAVNGDPFKLQTFRWNGLQSGGPTTSMHSKMIVPLVIYTGLKRIGAIPNSATLDQFLSHELDVALLNQGDDTVILSTFHIDEKVIEELGLGVLKLEQEKGVKFAGQIFNMQGKNLLIHHDAVSFVEKLFVPERSWDSRFHKYRMYGIMTSMGEDIYGANPKFNDVLTVCKSVFEKHYSYDLIKLITDNMKMPEDRFIDVVELDVMLDISKIYWKYDISELKSVDLSQYITIMDRRTSDKFREVMILKDVDLQKLADIGDSVKIVRQTYNYLTEFIKNSMMLKGA